MFRHPITDQTVTLFPMIHIGEQFFYDQVQREACSHDVILVEGVNSVVGKRLTTAYRWIGDRLGLVVQPKVGIACSSKIVHADLSGEAFERVWAELPLWQRWLVGAVAPIMGLHLRWFGTREAIASRLGMDDAMSRDELLRWNPETASMTKALLEARDAHLISTLSEQLVSQTSIAVVYGAAHMRTVIRDLMQKRGFACVETEWMLVFAL